MADRYRAFTCQRGRWFFAAHPHSLNLPRLSLSCDGDYVGVAASYGNGNSDPVALVDVDLSGTRVGRTLADLYWRVRG